MEACNPAGSLLPRERGVHRGTPARATHLPIKSSSPASLRGPPTGQAGGPREKRPSHACPAARLPKTGLGERRIPLTSRLLHRLRDSGPHGVSVCDSRWPQDMWANQCFQKTLELSEFSSRAFRRDSASPHVCPHPISEPAPRWRETVPVCQLRRVNMQTVLSHINCESTAQAFHVAKHCTVTGLTGALFNLGQVGFVFMQKKKNTPF